LIKFFTQFFAIGRMFSNLQLNITSKNVVRMEQSGQHLSQDAILQEWEEVQAAQQDRKHFRPLYNRYYEPVFRFVYRRTLDEALSADICSQVFLKALQRLDRYTFRGVPFSAWLLRIASNEVAQHFRQAKKERVVALDKVPGSEWIEEIPEWDDREDNRQLLIEVLDELKEKDLQLIELRFFEKRPFKEIGEILEITESNAKVRTYRILERLKKKLRKKGLSG
jgi:RNA polymerase sigma-70 factor (ECF subfamily)